MAGRELSYLVTGHTSGIGAEICRQLGDRAHGVSRATGYDITSQEDRGRIVDMFRDYDVLINNAYADDISQNTLLHEAFLTWITDTDKTIVNIGSAVTEYTLTPEYEFLNEYQANKQDLMNHCAILQHGYISVQYVTFGYVGTERIRTKYPEITEYIEPSVAADFVIKTPLIGKPMNRIQPNAPFSQTRTDNIPQPTG